MKFKNSFNKNLFIFASSMMAAIILFLYGSIFHTLLSNGEGFGWKDLLKPFSLDQVKDITAFIESIIVHIIEFCIDALKSFLNR
ncbi:MAG: hypothetical protein FJ219_08235 [Ignavibacteria bacterium]|nr:hypothetical protein [Ignavibacteria bacterium]